jgi:hypothetical protein
MGKLKVLVTLIEEQINSSLLEMVFAVLKLIFLFLIAAHTITCGWYAIGTHDAEGWTSYYAPTKTGPRDFMFWYFASCRWTLAQINGRTDMDERRNVVELGYTCVVATLFAVVFMALFISTITTTMMELSNAASSKFSAQREVKEFVHLHKISTRLGLAIRRHVKEAMNMEDAQQQENRITGLLPRSLGNDLMYEVRTPLLNRNSFFHGFNREYPRIMRMVCFSAIQFMPVARWEVVFEKGDICSRMLFVDAGVMIYLSGPELENSEDEPNAMVEVADGIGDVLRKGMFISEPALWCEWQNQGRLAATRHCTLLSVDADKFADQICKHKDAQAWSVMYAKHLVQELRELATLSDLVKLEESSPKLHHGGSGLW